MNSRKQPSLLEMIRFFFNQPGRILKIIGQFVILVLISAGPVFAGEHNLNIAMLLWRGETDAEIGFKDGLHDLGYSANLEIYDCRQDVRKLGSLLHAIKNRIEEFDYIYTFGTTVSRRAKVVIGEQVPQIFNIVTDPVAAGIVDNIDSPGENIGGGSDAIKISTQLGLVTQIFKFKKIGFFFNPREKNSLIIRDELYRFAEKHELEVIDFRSPPVHNILLDNLQKLTQNHDLIDVVYLSADSYLVSEGKLIASYLRKAKVKSISQVPSLIDQGVLMGVVGDYYDLGRAVAKIVDDHRKGESLENIPIKHFKNFKLIINQTTADVLGLTFDESIYSKAELVK